MTTTETLAKPEHTIEVRFVHSPCEDGVDSNVLGTAWCTCDGEAVEPFLIVREHSVDYSAVSVLDAVFDGKAPDGPTFAHWRKLETFEGETSCRIMEALIRSGEDNEYDWNLDEEGKPNWNKCLGVAAPLTDSHPIADRHIESESEELRLRREDDLRSLAHLDELDGLRAIPEDAFLP